MRTLSKEQAKASTLTTAKLPPRHFLDIANLDSKRSGASSTWLMR